MPSLETIEIQTNPCRCPNFRKPLKVVPGNNSDPSTEEGESMTRLYYQRAGVSSRGWGEGGYRWKFPPKHFHLIDLNIQN